MTRLLQRFYLFRTFRTVLYSSSILPHGGATNKYVLIENRTQLKVDHAFLLLESGELLATGDVGSCGACFDVLHESSELQRHPATTTLPTRFLFISIRRTNIQALVITCHAMKTISKMTSMWRASKSDNSMIER